nr:MAG TPA: hypothetical protein [Caudoviricetes sp.]
MAQDGCRNVELGILNVELVGFADFELINVELI